MTPSARRVLVVDDEEPLLKLMDRYLTRAGYEVDACGLAEEAWRLFSDRDSAYDVVVVDLSLPDLPGDALLERMRRLRPQAAAVICSGMPAPGECDTAAGRTRYLQKPFLPGMLLEAVEAAANASAPPG